jgi:DnaK suppressor protein
MKKQKLEYFKTKLLDARNKILNSGVLSNFEDLHINSDDTADEADLASNTINQQVSFSIREKEMTKLRRIDAALERVEDGSFGFCLESGDEIEEKRLETQPWAEFCIEVAEEKEREQAQRFHRRA